MGNAETRFFSLCAEVGFDVDQQKKFDWLTSQVLPGRSEREDELWRMFKLLGGSEKAMKSKSPRRLSPDGYMSTWNCLIEFDELQHFTAHRAKSLEAYPKDIPLGYDVRQYTDWCAENEENAFNRGAAGFRKPKPEFPFEGGRAAQRALFDACRDLIPSENGLAPTIRVASFQIPDLAGDARLAREQVERAVSRYAPT